MDPRIYCEEITDVNQESQTASRYPIPELYDAEKITTEREFRMTYRRDRPHDDDDDNNNNYQDTSSLSNIYYYYFHHHHHHM